jgi:hypothetical protein
VARLRFKIAMSLDGYIAGPRQSKKNPLGVGGDRREQLFEGVKDLGGLRLVRTAAAPNVTHLKFVRD